MARKKSYKPETQAAFNRRMSQERDADSKKAAAKRRKAERERINADKRSIAADRKAKVTDAREACKADVQKAKESTTKRGSRRVAVASAKVGCAARAKEIEQGFAARLDDLEARFDALSAEARSSRRYGSNRKRTTTRSTATERRQERDDAIRAELRRRGLGELVPIWDRERTSRAFRGLSFDRAIERFLESLENEENARAQNYERQEAEGEALAAQTACQQAQGYLDDPEAAHWFNAHCHEDATPRKRPKLSAAARTLSMFDGVAPPTGQPEAAAPPKKARGASKHQQRFGVGPLGASMLDVPF